MTRIELADPELAVHVFAPLTGPRRHEAYGELVRVWRGMGEALGMTQPIPALAPLPAVPPAELADLPPDTRAVCACQAPGDGVYQALLRREHDVACLSVMLAPAGLEPLTGWDDLARVWDGLARLWDGLGPPDQANILGEVRLSLAVWAGSAGAPVPNQVASRSGLRISETATPGDDDRSLRRLTVLAAKDQAEELSAWVWTRGEPELAPLTRYLLQMAKVRYQMRVWAQGRDTRAVRDRADHLLDGLLPAVIRQDGRRGAVSDSVLNGWSGQLESLVADEAGLIMAVTQVRGMRRTVGIAAANMDRAVGSEVDIRAGLFGDDRAVTEWFDQQLDDAEEYLRSAHERVNAVGAIIDRAVSRRQQQRQERLTRRQTAIVGALAMALTAAQALSYQVPVPLAVKPVVIVLLGVVAFYLSLAITRPSSRAHRRNRS